MNTRRSPKPSILIDVDKASTSKNEKQTTRCDFIFVGGSDESWVVPIELKKGPAKSSEVVKQLEAGAQFMDRLIPRNIPVRFRLVVAFRGIRKQQANELKKRKIRFRGKEVQVKLLRCGGSLVSALRDN